MWWMATRHIVLFCIRFVCAYIDMLAIGVPDDSRDAFVRMLHEAAHATWWGMGFMGRSLA